MDPSKRFAQGYGLQQRQTWYVWISSTRRLLLVRIGRATSQVAALASRSFASDVS